jgi:hypothetical protein
MKMVTVHHKDTKEPIRVPACDLQSFAEKGWHPAAQDKKSTVKPVEVPVESVDTEEVE